MSTDPTYPQLIRTGHHHWGYVGWRPFRTISEEEGVRAMCDYGAAAFARGECDHLAIDALGSEVPLVRAYMAEKHPTVPYTIGEPEAVLAQARRNWEQARKP